MEVFVINKKTEARDWGEISFETDSHAEWSYSDWDGIYNYEIESVSYYE
jgi:hypothetical protein